jgi:F0F1-type ATP synthase assembly protein I
MFFRTEAFPTRVRRMQISRLSPPTGQPLLFERTFATFPGDDRKRVERQYLRFAGVGVQYAATILVLTLLGIWVDGRAGTGSAFTIVFLLLGFVGATWSLVQQVLGPSKPEKKE